MPQSDPRRSGAIECYRFLFSVVVCLFHFRIKGNFPGPTGTFSAGYLGVEFFSRAGPHRKRGRRSSTWSGAMLPGVSSACGPTICSLWSSSSLCGCFT